MLKAIVSTDRILQEMWEFKFIIAPLTSGEFVWIVNAQERESIGHFFLTGEFDTRLMIAIGGPSIVNPCHIKSRMGAPIKPYIDDNVKDGENRFISGDVLTGKKITQDDHIGFYDSAISAVPEGGKEFSWNVASWNFILSL